MYFWFDWVKTEEVIPENYSIDRNDQIKKIKNLRKLILVTAIPLWILSTILLTPIMIDFYHLDDPSGIDLMNNYFKFGIISGFLGTSVTVIGTIRLFTIHQSLNMYYAEKQLQFS